MSNAELGDDETATLTVGSDSVKLIGVNLTGATELAQQLEAFAANHAAITADGTQLILDQTRLADAITLTSDVSGSAFVAGSEIETVGAAQNRIRLTANVADVAARVQSFDVEYATANAEVTQQANSSVAQVTEFDFEALLRQVISS